jgi:hypothetical protein
MKKTLISLFVALPMLQIIQAQGITYLSNLNQPSAGNLAVGSDSWLAVGFDVGTNASGYMLNSIQLNLTGASGNPNTFVFLLYSAIGHGDFYPGSSLGTLNGSTDPSVGGVFTYFPAEELMLLPNTAYFIVLTAGTAVANGAYDWSYAGSSFYNSSGGWQAPLGRAAVDNYQSIDGSNWNVFGGSSQFAITATPIPEPSAEMLLGLGGILLLGCGRWKAKAVY